MTLATFDEQKLKDLLKAAIIELLEERRDLVRDILEEALEDIGLASAIEEGERSTSASREAVFKILKASS